MLEQDILDLDLCSDENEVLLNGSEQPNNEPHSGYFHFEPVVSKSFMVAVDNPEKVGEGISAFMVYHVHFEGFVAPFEGIKSSVVRRFSDFITMYEKLVAKHLPNGIVVPPAPGKEFIGTTRLKITKNVCLENAFVERRRYALQRFLTRLFNHPILSSDKDLLDFIQQSDAHRNPTQLTLSTTAKRIIKNFGGAFAKASYKMDEPDDPIVDEDTTLFFYAKSEELTSWDKQLRRLHSALVALGAAEQEFATTKYAESRALAALANAEEHTGLAGILARLSSTEDEISQVQSTQANSQIFHLVESVVDIIDLIQVCKDVLAERVKAYRSWKSTERLVRTKRAQAMSLQESGKADRIKMSQYDSEIGDLCIRVDEEEFRFNQISKTIKNELAMFDVIRFTELKRAAIEHLEVMYSSQSKLLGYWEAYLAQACSID